MATVVDDTTGEEVEVQPVEAVVAISSITDLASEFPADAAKRIESAMTAAISNAMEEGVSDPKELRERMLKARESMKISMRSEQRDARSQAEAAARGM